MHGQCGHTSSWAALVDDTRDSLFEHLGQAILRGRASPSQGPILYPEPCEEGMERRPACLGQEVPSNRELPQCPSQKQWDRRNPGDVGPKKGHQDKPRFLSLYLAEDRLEEREWKEGI